MTEEQAAKEWLLYEFRYNKKEYLDECNELNYTKIAEDCANSLNIYENEVDYKIPDWLFSMVIDVAEKFEQKLYR